MLLVFSCNTDSKGTEADFTYSKEKKFGFIKMILVLVAFNILLHGFSKEPAKEENEKVSSYAKHSICKSE